MAVFSIAMLILMIDELLPSGSYELFRCICGFLVGHWVWRIARTIFVTARFATAAEIAVVVSAALYMTLANLGPLSLLAPVFFGPAVWVFSAGRGAISSILRLPPFLNIGALSYSIYMTHFVILRAGLTFAKAADKFLHINIVTDYNVPGSGIAQFFNFGNRWIGDLSEIPYIAAVIIVSMLTFRYIEIPARNFFYQKAGDIADRES